MHADSKAAVSLDSLSHRYGRYPAVRDVSLEVGAGRVHCLLGPSGSGKSTLLRLIAGLEDLQRGEIAIAGEIVVSPARGVWRPPEQRSVGFVFQDYALFPHLSVLRNVTFGMGRSADKRRRALALLDQVEMTELADVMPHTLSGGQQQRVALARALARSPHVMLLDEPFSGLDRHLRAAVRQRTIEVLRDAGVATIVVTHDPNEAHVLADAISVMRDGRLLQTGTADELYRRPSSVDVAEVFGVVNRLAAERIEGTNGHFRLPWGARLDLGEPSGGPARDGRVELLLPADAVRLERDGQARLKGVVVQVELGFGQGVVVDVRLDGPAGAELRCYGLLRDGWEVGERVGVEVSLSEAVTVDG